jgi:hypothetical protein
MMNTSKETTLRLVFPQWQGGNNPPYYFGSELLSWLAPDPTGPVEQVDVLDPRAFRSLLFAKPNVPADVFEGIAQGKMTTDQVVRVLGDVAKVVDVVGLGITEHLPWDALALKGMIARLPLIGTPAGQRS